MAILVLYAVVGCSNESPDQPVKVERQVEPTEQNKVTPDGKKQSFFEGMQTLCESYSKAPKSHDPAEAQKHLHRWIESNVTNTEVREVFTLIGTMPPGQRSGMMRAAAAKVGLTHCSLAGD